MDKAKTIISNKSKKRVFVAMSGGVDSSVAALLLKNEGYDVVGVFMRCFNVDGCAEKDAEDARRVAEKLGIPFYVWDFEEEYKKKVVKYMVDGYRHGITPNPDVMCNKEIKFGLFLEKALAMGADYVATGHYARKLCFARTGVKISPAEISRLHLGSAARLIRRDQARRTSDSFSQSKVSFGLGIGKDKNKDQSYFLWTLTQKQLRHCLFPIGDYVKPEVREIARKAGLPTADKKDSQGICFLGRVKLDDFLGRYIKPKTGQVRLAQSDGSYKVIGEHSGAQFYTIGQRHIGVANRGLTRLPARSQAKAGNELFDVAQSRRGLTRKTNFEPLYVAEKDIKANTLTVAEGSNNPALYKKEVLLRDVNFINPSYSLIRANKRIGNKGIKVMARVRYRQPLAGAHLRLSANGESHTNKRIRGKLVNSRQIRYVLIFDVPQKFVASGQSAVFYLPPVASAKEGSSLEMLGGGVIL
ncbi:MAG: tRNA-specific 2-thiouridylase [Candidatus Liptonbacteria bacterium]|nr:tRNA-specific 2-thiouridylase [Candidatus Liptonbacteria bacterium]